MNPPLEIDENNLKQLLDHMPDYIVKAPWYVTTTLEGMTTLKHQKLSEERRNRFTPLTSSVERGFYKGNVYRFRKGACENCGAITHKTKECFERPRKRGAKYTKNNFRNDEYIKPLPYKNDYEGKRDRWNGYEPAKELDKFKEYENIEKQIELREEENNKEKSILEEVKEEDKLKDKKIENLENLIAEKKVKEEEMKKNDELLLDVKEKDYLEMIKDKKLKEILEKFGGEKHLYIPESIKNGNNLAEFPNEEEEEIEEDDEEKKLRKQEEKARIFRTMMMDRKNQVRLERKRIKLLAIKTKRAAAGLSKICENSNNN